MSRDHRYYKQNRLQQLRGFCYAARSGSISRAAREMSLSQPSVSLQIQALEREFGTTLFERKGPKIKLTADGELLFELAAPLVENVEALRDAFIARRENVDRGRLDIAAGESTILYILPRFVKAFAEAYPGIELKIHNVTGRDGLALLRAGEVDFAVGSMIDVPADIHYHPTFVYDPVLITSRTHPLTRRKKVTLEAVSAHPLILPPRHLTTWRVVDLAFRQYGLKYDVRLEAGGWEVIKKYVSMGLGVSIVTSVCLTGAEPLATIPFDRYFPKRTYGLVTRRAGHLSPQARRFIELIKPDFFGPPPDAARTRRSRRAARAE
jgi:DNA-binding transcriptional LysR family regulator